MWYWSDTNVTFDNAAYGYDGSGPVPVPGGGFPNLIGLQYLEAILDLQEQGYYNPQSLGYFGSDPIGIYWDAGSGFPSGTVIAQIPAAGQGGVTVNSPVQLAVAEFDTSVAWDNTLPTFPGLEPPTPPPPPPPPPGAPTAPLNVVGIPGNAFIKVTFDAPVYGAPISYYTVHVTGGTGVWNWSDTFVTFDNPAFTYAGDGGTPVTFYVEGLAPPIFVYDLQNGVDYTFTVTATNPYGTGPASVPSAPVAPFTYPGAASNLVATAGNASATLSFAAAPANGSPITQYVGTSTPGNVTARGAASPLTFAGLTNGTTYTFTVVATNAAGAGPPSASSNAVVPQAAVTVPGAPTAVIATPGNARASIAFTPPANTGGSPITGYRVTASNGAVQTGSGSPIVMTGLTNGTTYTFTVIAINAVGNSVSSAPSSPVTPFTVPGAATALAAVAAGSGAATLTFVPAPANGSAITGYTVTSSPAGGVGSGTTSPIAITGLTNGVSYTFTLVARNAAGNGPTSLPSNAVTPLAVPGAPTGVSASAGNAQATVTFTAPTNTGGSPITSYTVIGSGNHSASGSASPITVTGLTNGTAYTFQVYATNAVGNGPLSAASSAVTPFTVPGAATGVSATAGNMSATVYFTAAPANGSAITGYTVYSTAGGFSQSGASSPITVTGLTNGTTYQFYVVATNAAGAGPNSANSNVVTPANSGTFTAPTKGKLPNGVAGHPYSYVLPLSGGTAPYTVTIVNAAVANKSATCGVQPTPGNTYTISGTTLQCANPTAQEQDYFLLKFQDSTGANSELVCTVTIGPAGTVPLVINTPATLGNVPQNVAANLGAVTCVGNVGTPTWSMPATGGFTINATTGVISGTPTTLGTYSLNVTVSDGTYTASQTLYVTVNQVVTGATRPAGNTGSGFFVLNSELYDANGTLFRIRGFDSLTPFGVAISGFAWPNPNTIRMFGGTPTSVTSAANQGQLGVPVVGYAGPQTSCNADVSVLENAVGQWTAAYSSWAPLMNKMIVNIANEWGPDTTATWANAYIAVMGQAVTNVAGNTITLSSSSSTNPFANCPFAWIAGAGGITDQLVTITGTGGSSGSWTVTLSAALSGYTSGGTLNGGAIGVLRAQGWTCPIMVDSNGCGQNNTSIVDYGNAIFASDPQRNIIMSFHLYGGTSQANAIPVLSALANAAHASGYCVAVMEYGPYDLPALGGAGAETQIPTLTLISYCEQVGLGYCGWAIDNNSCSGEEGNDAQGFSMLYYNYSAINVPSSYTQFGKYVCLDPIYGLQANAVLATSL